MVASTVANFAGKTMAENAPIKLPADFMPLLREFEPAKQLTEDGSILMADPAAQAALIRKAIFRKDG
jgi:hypothetical protein